MYNIKPENMYNMDESGFAIGEKEARRCIVNSEVRQNFHPKLGRHDSIHAVSRLYKDNFRTVFQLTEQMRQQGLSEEDLKFATALLHMRIGAVTPEDWQFFQHQVLSEFPVAERLGFANAVSLFMTNNEVRPCKDLKV